MRRISFGFGLLCAMGWYLVFGWRALEFHNPHLEWRHVHVAALISFVAGWCIAQLAGWLFSESRSRRNPE
jgi:hypothetical protein